MLLVRRGQRRQPARKREESRDGRGGRAGAAPGAVSEASAMTLSQRKEVEREEGAKEPWAC